MFCCFFFYFYCLFYFFFFFSSRRRHTRLVSDWSSDVCSSDLKPFAPEVVRLKVERALELRAARHDRSRLAEENAYLRAGEAIEFGEMVGRTEDRKSVV